MNVPENIRAKIRARLWGLADEVGWLSLSSSTKASYYETWTRDAEIGEVLSHYMDKGKVRVYLKDSLLKSYTRERLAGADRPFRVLGLPADAPVSEVYIKPHGRQLADGRIICWGRAEDWKSVLMALHERSQEKQGLKPFGAVLTQADGRLHEQAARNVVADAALKLGIEKLIWLDS